MPVAVLAHRHCLKGCCSCINEGDPLNGMLVGWWQVANMVSMSHGLQPSSGTLVAAKPAIANAAAANTPSSTLTGIMMRLTLRLIRLELKRPRRLRFAAASFEQREGEQHHCGTATWNNLEGAGGGANTLMVTARVRESITVSGTGRSIHTQMASSTANPSTSTTLATSRANGRSVGKDFALDETSHWRAPPNPASRNGRIPYQREVLSSEN